MKSGHLTIATLPKPAGLRRSFPDTPGVENQSPTLRRVFLRRSPRPAQVGGRVIESRMRGELGIPDANPCRRSAQGCEPIDVRSYSVRRLIPLASAARALPGAQPDDACRMRRESHGCFGHSLPQSHNLQLVASATHAQWRRHGARIVAGDGLARRARLRLTVSFERALGVIFSSLSRDVNQFRGGGGPLLG